MNFSAIPKNDKDVGAHVDQTDTKPRTLFCSFIFLVKHFVAKRPLLFWLFSMDLSTLFGMFNAERFRKLKNFKRAIQI